MEKLQAEPQFALVSPFTGEVVMLAAQSMIVPLDMSELSADSAEGEIPEAELVRWEQETGEHRDNYPRTEAEQWAEIEARAAEDDPYPDGFGGPKIILPGTAEALGIETPEAIEAELEAEAREHPDRIPAWIRWPDGAPT